MPQRSARIAPQFSLAKRGKVEQIVIDRDKEGALDFVKEVVKKQIDRENASKMKREGI